MAKTSAARDRFEHEIRRLSADGMSQRNIATRLGIQRSLVQRVLASPAKSTGNADSDAFNRDFAAQQAEFFAEPDLEGLRFWHGVAQQAFSEGYRPAYNPLPLLTLLTPLANDSPVGVEREKLRAEIRQIFADNREFERLREETIGGS